MCIRDSPDIFRAIRRGHFHAIFDYSTSLFAIACFAVSYVLLTMVFELTPGSQVPFFFFGGAVVAGIILLQANIPDLLEISPSNIRYAIREPSILVTGGSILFFVILTLNISMIPFISQDIPFFLSVFTLITVFYWTWRLSQEGMKPSVQERRTAALVYLALLPFIFYLLLRVVYLQHDPDPVMANRWEILSLIHI